jgi:hypothetical protein
MCLAKTFSITKLDIISRPIAPGTPFSQSMCISRANRKLLLFTLVSYSLLMVHCDPLNQPGSHALAKLPMGGY